MENDKKYFEDKFKNFESAPPLGVWNDIESGLDKKAGKRKAIIFMRIAAGLALLITAAWFTWSSFNQETNKLTLDKDSTKVETVEENVSLEKQQIAAIDSENQQKLIKPKQQRTNKNQKPEANQADDKKNISSSENNKVQLNQKNIVKDTIKLNKEKPEEKQKIELLESIEHKPLLAENQIDSIQPVETQENEQLLAQIETEEDTDIQNESDSKSITIILRPKSNNEALASNDKPEEEKGTFEKFKETINKDFYKYKIRLGEVPDLALNKLKLKSN